MSRPRSSSALRAPPANARAEQHAEWTSVRATRRFEERALFERFALDRNPISLEPLVERFMPLARQLARRYRSSGEIEDLEQVAAIGLVKAINRFDPERGLAFSSFVRLERATDELAMELGRAPTVTELAQRIDSTVEQVLETRQAATARRAGSLDQPCPETDDRPDIGMEVAVDEAGFATAEESATLNELLGCLTERERLVLELRFRNDLTQRQIGEITGISQMQVSRVIRHAIAQLQTAADSSAGS